MGLRRYLEDWRCLFLLSFQHGYAITPKTQLTHHTGTLTVVFLTITTLTMRCRFMYLPHKTNMELITLTRKLYGFTQVRTNRCVLAVLVLVVSCFSGLFLNTL